MIFGGHAFAKDAVRLAEENFKEDLENARVNLKAVF